MICYLLELQVDAASPARWLFPADCSPATLAGEQVDETRLAFNPLRPETHHAIKLCLLGMSERLRWEAIGQQTGCSDLRRGLDLTVPRALSKAKESNLRRGTLSMVWQGAQGKGKPKGKGKGKGSYTPEELRNASEVNQWRRANNLPAKSTGPINRSRRRSDAHHAA